MNLPMVGQVIAAGRQVPVRLCENVVGPPLPVVPHHCSHRGCQDHPLHSRGAIHALQYVDHPFDSWIHHQLVLLQLQQSDSGLVTGGSCPHCRSSFSCKPKHSLFSCNPVPSMAPAPPVLQKSLFTGCTSSGLPGMRDRSPESLSARLICTTQKHLKRAEILHPLRSLHSSLRIHMLINPFHRLLQPESGSKVDLLLFAALTARTRVSHTPRRPPPLSLYRAVSTHLTKRPKRKRRRRQTSRSPAPGLRKFLFFHWLR